MILIGSTGIPQILAPASRHCLFFADIPEISRLFG